MTLDQVWQDVGRVGDAEAAERTPECTPALRHVSLLNTTAGPRSPHPSPRYRKAREGWSSELLRLCQLYRTAKWAKDLSTSSEETWPWGGLTQAPLVHGKFSQSVYILL